jgi:hypothetical protein
MQLLFPPRPPRSSRFSPMPGWVSLETLLFIHLHNQPTPSLHPSLAATPQPSRVISCCWIVESTQLVLARWWRLDLPWSEQTTSASALLQSKTQELFQPSPPSNFSYIVKCATYSPVHSISPQLSSSTLVANPAMASSSTNPSPLPPIKTEIDSQPKKASPGGGSRSSLQNSDFLANLPPPRHPMSYRTSPTQERAQLVPSGGPAPLTDANNSSNRSSSASSNHWTSTLAATKGPLPSVIFAIPFPEPGPMLRKTSKTPMFMI